MQSPMGALLTYLRFPCLLAPHLPHPLPPRPTRS